MGSSLVPAVSAPSCSVCQAKEKQQRLLLFLGKNGSCRSQWAFPFMHTQACALYGEGTSANMLLVQSVQRKASHGMCVGSMCGTGPWEGFRSTLCDGSSLCGCRARQAEVCELPRASHCYWEGGDFLFIESFPLFCSSFLMINVFFIIPTNSTLLLEILSLIQISVGESNRKNVFSSWEKTLPFKIPEPRAPPWQHPPAVLRHRQNMCTQSVPTWATPEHLQQEGDGSAQSSNPWHFPGLFPPSSPSTSLKYKNLLVFRWWTPSCASRGIYPVALFSLFLGLWLSLLSAK